MSGKMWWTREIVNVMQKDYGMMMVVVVVSKTAFLRRALVVLESLSVF